MIRHSFRRTENDNIAARQEKHHTGHFKGTETEAFFTVKNKVSVLKWMDVGRVLSVIFHILLS